MPSPSPNPSLTRCPVLYQDEFLVAVDKPEGVLSHPNPVEAGDRARCRAAFAGSYDLQDRRFDTPAGPIWLVHRLDRDTSGLLLATRDAETATRCRSLFETNRITKMYLALLGGQPSPPAGRWRDCLTTRRGRGQAETVVQRHRPPNAELHYRVQRALSAGRCSLVELTLLTGRTHQIRVQAAARRLPIAGDRRYGVFAWNRELRQQAGLRRLFLHAWRLDFPHPQTGKPLRLESALPAALRDCLQRLA
ncbi:RluA family pseudouridine synthase [bacterium]|nr:RluA family pseudouridine synthase [bacterium]